jgi:hypothetical protein
VGVLPTVNYSATRRKRGERKKKRKRGMCPKIIVAK